jgi:serine/threonine protein kinase
LKEYLKKNKLYESEIKNIIFQILEGIHYLHENDVIHGELSTNHIFITKEKQVKIKFLGIDTFLLNYELGELNFSFNPFESFETSENNEPTFMSDVWSIGVIWYLMIYHKYPFNNKMETYENKFKLPNESNISKDLMDLLSNIFKIESERLTLFELLNSKYFDESRYHKSSFSTEDNAIETDIWIPDEVMLIIFSYLEPVDLIPISLTNKNWSKLTSSISWKDQFENDFYRYSNRYYQNNEMGFKLLYIKKYKENMRWIKEISGFNCITLLKHFLNPNQKRFTPPTILIKEQFPKHKETILNKMRDINLGLNYLFIFYLGIVINQPIFYFTLILFSLTLKLFENQKLQIVVNQVSIYIISTIGFQHSHVLQCSKINNIIVTLSIALFASIGESIPMIFLRDTTKRFTIENRPISLINFNSFSHLAMFVLLFDGVLSFLVKTFTLLFEIGFFKYFLRLQTQFFFFLLIYFFIQIKIYFISTNIFQRKKLKQRIVFYFYLIIVLNIFVYFNQ